MKGIAKMTNKCLTIRAPHNENVELVYLLLQRETYMKSYWTSIVPPHIVEFKVISNGLNFEKIKSDIQSIYSKEDKCEFSIKPLNDNTYNNLREIFLND